MLTLNVAKLSYTADLPPNHIVDGPDWTHIQNEGPLAAVFDTFRSNGTPSVHLRVAHASRILYDISIEEMIRTGEHLQARSRPGAVKVDDLPVYCIYRPPFLLAIRWISQEKGTVCRIQMRFASEKEYQAAFDCVRQLGLHMTPARTGSKPQSSSTSFPPVDYRASSNRPLTATGTSTSPLQTQLRDSTARPFSAQSRNAHPLSPPVYFPRPDSATSVMMNEHFTKVQPIVQDAQRFGLPSAADLPPRRELPFSRPDTGKSTDSDAAHVGSRPSSSLMGPPQLPTPRASLQRPTSRAGSSPRAELPPLAKPTLLGKFQDISQAKASSSRQMFDRGTSKAGRPQSATINEKEYQCNTSFPSLSRPLTSDGAFPHRAPLRVTSEATQNERSSEAFSALATSPPPTSELGHQTTNAALNELAQYAKQDDEVRFEALNNFLLKHLESDDFLALVDDTEAAWARIVPGFGSGGKNRY